MKRLILAGTVCLSLSLVTILITREHTTQASPAKVAVENNSPANVPGATTSRGSETAATLPDGSLSDPSLAPGGHRANEAPTPQTISGIPDVDPHVAFGSKTAAIVMEVFSDFQCPACKTLFMTTNRQLMDNYVSTGKVYLIHRDFPLAMHAHSKVAAQYSRAAADIGKFEPVEQALFQNQEKWEQTGDVDGTVAAVLSSAEMAKVRALVKSGAPETAIEKDLALGRTYNVSQTPTTVFHAKGQTFPYGGGMSYDILKGFLDQLAAQR